MALFWIILLYLGPVLSALLAVAMLRRKFAPGKILFVFNLVMLIIFGICIVYPYYFQGYKDITHPMPGPALGLTKLPLISVFAYLYSSAPLGFVWLTSGLAFLMLGEIGIDKKTEMGLKILIALIYSFLILNLHRFDVIGTVLE
jgi:hypothetical protein